VLDISENDLCIVLQLLSSRGMEATEDNIKLAFERIKESQEKKKKKGKKK
jgi:hypothetical protein